MRALRLQQLGNDATPHSTTSPTRSFQLSFYSCALFWLLHLQEYYNSDVRTRPLHTCVEVVPPLLAKSLGVDEDAVVVAVGGDDTEAAAAVAPLEAAATDGLLSLMTFTRIFLSAPVLMVTELRFSFSPPTPPSRSIRGFSCVGVRIN